MFTSNLALDCILTEQICKHLGQQFSPLWHLNVKKDYTLNLHIKSILLLNIAVYTAALISFLEQQL